VALAYAENLAARCHQEKVDEKHVLAGLLMLPVDNAISLQSIAILLDDSESFEKLNALKAELLSSFKGETGIPGVPMGFSPGMEAAFQEAQKYVEYLGDAEINSEHLLVGLAKSCQGEVRAILDSHRISAEAICGVVEHLQLLRLKSQSAKVAKIGFDASAARALHLEMKAAMDNDAFEGFVTLFLHEALISPEQGVAVFSDAIQLSHKILGNVTIDPERKKKTLSLVERLLPAIKSALPQNPPASADPSVSSH
jgi:ATP-dependent Clp protease ATP-binding subunit ClpA